MDTREQIALADQLKGMLLKEYHKRLVEGTITDTGMANLQRLLQGSGWVLDDTSLPQDLRSKLTRNVDPRKFSDDDGVVGRIA